MKNRNKFVFLAAIALLSLPLAAGAVVEEKSGTEYPDEVTVEAGGESHSLVVTGVGLREKTIMKVDVYTIVSYVAADAALAGDDLGLALQDYDGVKQIRMDLRRSFSREKLCGAFTGVIDKNFKDQSAFASDTDVFLAYFERDAEDGDVLDLRVDRQDVLRLLWVDVDAP